MADRIEIQNHVHAYYGDRVMLYLQDRNIARNDADYEYRCKRLATEEKRYTTSYNGLAIVENRK